MNWKLYLDDIRTPDDPTFMIVRTVNDAQKLIHLLGVPTFISFDHDLGMDDEGNLVLSGYDFAKWLVEMDMEGIFILVEDFDFTVHSQNPVGAKNIREYLNNYLSFRTKSTNQDGKK
jgi:hypothetical protein